MIIIQTGGGGSGGGGGGRNNKRISRRRRRQSSLVFNVRRARDRRQRVRCASALAVFPHTAARSTRTSSTQTPRRCTTRANSAPRRLHCHVVAAYAAVCTAPAADDRFPRLTRRARHHHVHTRCRVAIRVGGRRWRRRRR